MDLTTGWQNSYNIENLIFEGGGIRGCAYGGALAAMSSFGLLKKLKRVGGASAGAIAALLIAIGYTSLEISAVLASTDFSEFQDDSFGVFRDTYRLVKHYGWHKGDALKDWLGGHVTAQFGRADFTFGGLHRASERSPLFKDLYVVATNLTRQRIEVYSYETTPNMSIVEAVRISLSIPAFFQCVKNEKGEVLVDGGVACNYPIKLFDKQKYVDSNCRIDSYRLNSKTVGFRLDTKAEIDEDGWNSTPVKTDNFKQYISSIITFLMEMANKRHLSQCDKDRTIFIETGDVRATDFDLSKEKIQMLLKNGEKAVYKYFDCEPLKPLYGNYELT
jgi:NTE family protein